jgi:hypothetical protein
MGVGDDFWQGFYDDAIGNNQWMDFGNWWRSFHNEIKHQHLLNAGLPFLLNSNLPSGYIARLSTLSSLHLSIGFAGDFADNCGRRQQLALFVLWEERVREFHSGSYKSIGWARWYGMPFLLDYCLPSQCRDGSFSPDASGKTQTNSSIVYWIFYSISAFVRFATSFGIGKMRLPNVFVKTEKMLDEKRRRWRW